MRSVPRSEALDLTGRRLFITGGTGFVGRSLLDYLTESAQRYGGQFSVTVLSRDPSSFRQKHTKYADLPWLSYVAGDLSTMPAPGDYSDMIHAAADTHRVNDSIAWFEQLVLGTRSALDFAARSGVQRTLFVSSGAVYSPAALNAWPAEADDGLAPDLHDPATVYGQGKRAAEHLCALYNRGHDIGCVIARCFAIISPHMPLEGPYAAGNFIRDALSPTADALHISGNPETLRSYIDGRDMAHWLITLLTRGVPGEAYNVGSDQPVTILELARTVCAVLGITQNVAIAPDAHARPRSVYVPKTDKAAALGLRIETPLRNAIAEAATGRA